VNQYYNNTGEFPQEIILPSQLTDSEIIQNWLQNKFSQSILITVPQKGDKKKLVDMCTKNARYLLEELKLQKMKSKDKIPYVLHSLQRDLSLKKVPKRIECFDISNIQGTDPVGSMVCFVDGRPKKSEYRKYNIKSKQTPDDFAMINEVVFRRYQRILRENQTLPDLIVIDGGKGQLSSAVAALQKLKINDIPIMGLAKRMEEIFLPGFPDAQNLPKTSSSLKLLQQVRDEAHRFAITFHRQKRKKRTITSQLENIPGIGKIRRNKLLKQFGSVKAIRLMDSKELAKKSGLSHELADKIIEYLNKK